MANYPIAWYMLWVVVSICGVSTWYLDNFTDKIELKKLSAFTGIGAMITLLAWTLMEF